eukprot:scaffold1955_cov106-Skeletonema_dohrnii-CCMP3373.AAC.11
MHTEVDETKKSSRWANVILPGLGTGSSDPESRSSTPQIGWNHLNPIEKPPPLNHPVKSGVDT